MRTWTIEDLDRVITQAKANRRSKAYLAALERRREQLLAGERRASKAQAAGAEKERAGAEAGVIVGRWIEMSAELLGVAPAVGEEEALDVGRMMDCLATWFPLVSVDDEGDGDAA